MKRSHLAAVVVACLVIAAGARYLYDPPWVAGLTSGMREWEEDPPGTRFRWTTGRSSFYVPSGASEMTLTMRPLFPSADGRPVVVAVNVDDRWLADVELKHPTEWINATLPLPRRQTHRSYRRVELRVSRTVGEFNLGVQLGEVLAR